MRTALKVLAAVVVVMAIAIAAVLYATSGAREIARTFVMEVSSGDYTAANAHFHEALKQEYPIERMEAAFDGYAAYEDVRFSSVSASGGKTEISGTATTASGCSTSVMFEILDGQIIAFEMNPLCPE